MTREQQAALIAAAIAVRQNAYAPYSKFAVGAAILTASGEVITGANVENASYGLSLCAERVAAATAVATGKRDFAAIAIVTPGGAAPCGACRQFLAEFCPDIGVLLINADDPSSVRTTSLAKLLPEQFRL